MRRLRKSAMLALALAATTVAASAHAQSNPFPSDMRGVIERSGMQPSPRTMLHEALVQGRRPVSNEYEVSRLAGLMSQMLREGQGDELSRLCLEAVRAGRLDTIGEPLAMSLATNAVFAAMTDAPDLVPGLLARIDSPSTLVRFMAQRRYEPIWPQVEARVGPHQQTVMADMLAHERARFAANPNDSEMLQRLAFALFTAGLHEEVVTFVSEWRQRHRRAELDENVAWAINYQSYALFRLGRRDEALTLMEEIASLPNGPRGWVISFAINHAALLQSDERHEEALAAAQLAARMPGSDYARLLIARTRACALERLGRHDEAMRQLPFLRASLRISPAQSGRGLLCLGQRDLLVAELTRLLADEELARDNYALLQTDDDANTEDSSQGPSVGDVIAAEPDLRALLERWSRVIPAEFLPAGEAGAAG